MNATFLWYTDIQKESGFLNHEPRDNRIMHPFIASYKRYTEYFKWEMETPYYVCIDV